MATVTLDPAPQRDPAGSAAWTRWFNQIYNAVQQMLSGGTFTTPTLTNATLGGTTSVTGNETFPAGVPQYFQQTTGATITQRLYNDGTGKLVLDSAPDGTSWVNALRVGTDGAMTLTNASGLSFGSNWQTWTPALSASGSMTVSAVTANDASYLRLGPIVHIRLYISAATLGGTLSNQVYITLPTGLTNAGVVQGVSGHVVSGGGNWQAGVAWIEAGESRVKVMLSGQPNFAAGTFGALMSFSYRVT
jgi:hypothetical protein